MSDCYGFHYTSLKLAERRQRLEKWFQFKCQCVACGNKYPIMANLDSKLSQNNLDLLKSLLEKFQYSLKQDEVIMLKSLKLYSTMFSGKEESGFQHQIPGDNGNIHCVKTPQSLGGRQSRAYLCSLGCL